MIRIKKAAEKDIDMILELLIELGRPTPKNNAKRTFFKRLIRAYISEKDKHLLVAYHDSKVIGLASVIMLKRLNRTTQEMYMPELVVSSQYQGMGIGRELVSYCTKMAKRKKCFRLRLESGYSRKASHKFYKKIGFEDYALTFKKTLS